MEEILVTLDNKDIYLKSYRNNSVNLIYSSHFIEYFDRNEVISNTKKMEKNFKEKWNS